MRRGLTPRLARRKKRRRGRQEDLQEYDQGSECQLRGD